MSSHLQAVVIGARGMLGADLVELLERDGDFSMVTGTDLPETDITNEASLKNFLTDLKPDVIFNCAAITDVDACESQRDLAFAVNAEGGGRIARIAASLGARMIHVSTDYVFDGKKSSPYTEEDQPAPLSVYGESKLEGERLVAATGGSWAVVRTASLYGRGQSKFVDLMLRLAQERDELFVVADRISSPTWSRDLSAALAAIAKGNAQGLFHGVNSGTCSRFEMVRFMLDCIGAAAKVRPVDSPAFPRAAAVPAYSALSPAKLACEVGHVMRPWHEALRNYVTLRIH